MTEVVSIKFKNGGKNYFFAPPADTQISSGQKLIVETAKGLELVECTRGNHMVEDTAVVQPLRPVVRVATAEDLKADSANVSKEKEAFDVCQKKIADHGLEMKLVDVECNFEGSKITFFFTSDGRVDFRELVKDLASVFHTRIELRQIGVRDEAKMLGGIGICGRPYCCKEFLDDFAPVSTKMAKIQNLSLNPTKISGSCGRLMCCLRYEQEAYEELCANVPKNGAFVETPDGYGIAEQVNLLRQQIKVKLDGDPDGSLRLYKAKHVAAVPGGRPPEGKVPPHVLVIDEDEPDEEPFLPETGWETPSMFAEAEPEQPAEENTDVPQEPQKKKSNFRRRRNYRKKAGGKSKNPKAAGNGADQNAPKNTPKPKPKSNNKGK